MKPGWKTTEFWVMLGGIVAKVFVPSIPDDLIALAGTYIVGRAAQKGMTAIAKGNENAAATMAQAPAPVQAPPSR